jgi:hypothetical protein
MPDDYQEKMDFMWDLINPKCEDSVSIEQITHFLVKLAAIAIDLPKQHYTGLLKRQQDKSRDKQKPEKIKNLTNLTKHLADLEASKDMVIKRVTD